MDSNRRDFLKTGAMASLASLATFTVGAVATSRKNKVANENGKTPSKSKRRLLGTGNNSIEVSALGLGCMGMSYHRSFIPDRQAMITLIRKAIDLNVNLLDTAEAYGPFVNEQLIGGAIKTVRNDVILCTKFGFKEGKPELGLDSSPERIRQVVENSLKNLKTDYIDLLYQHRVDPNVPMEEVAGTVKDLIAEGKVKHFGLSERDFNRSKEGLDAIRKAHAVQPITAIKSEYSIMTRNPEEGVLSLCEELRIGFLPYSPLSRGFISGYINERTKFNPRNDNRISLPRYEPENIIANWGVIDTLKEFGDHRGLTVAQVALAWLLAQKPFIVSIVGTTKLVHLQENMLSVDYEFITSELAELTENISKIKIIGDRYTTGYPQ